MTKPATDKPSIFIAEHDVRELRTVHLVLA